MAHRRRPHVACLCAVLVAGPAAAAAAPHTVQGRLDIHAGFWSAELGSRRDVRILLPPDYEGQPERRYPVVYAAHGQDLFDAATAAGGEEWALDELLQARPAGIPEILVVGVDAGAHFQREYAPPGSRRDATGDAYVRFLVHELKPFVDHNYRTAGPGRGALILGDGAGAVLAIYAAWTRPRAFGAALALALPDVDAKAATWTRAPPELPPRLWIEQPGARHGALPSTTALLQALREGADVRFVVSSAGATRIARVAAGLRALLAE